MTSVPSSAGRPSLHRNPSSLRKLALAKSYGTFLLGMGDSEPMAVVSPSKGKARAVSQEESTDRDNGAGLGKWSTALSWIKSQDLQLANVGSVARDHLANERTFLAWLRTSLSLASIGVAITQLFRLSSSSYTLPSNPTSNPSTSVSSSTAGSPSLSDSDLASVVASLLVTVEQQQQALDALGLSTQKERDHYHRLGKPIGGTFIVLGVLLLVLGSNRYLSVQHHLTASNLFPPARRSILMASVFVAALLVSSFVSILVIN